MALIVCYLLTVVSVVTRQFGSLSIYLFMLIQNSLARTVFNPGRQNRHRCDIGAISCGDTLYRSDIAQTTLYRYRDATNLSDVRYRTTLHCRSGDIVAISVRYRLRCRYDIGHSLPVIVQISSARYRTISKRCRNMTTDAAACSCSM